MGKRHFKVMGFTIIEVIGILVILSLILTIAVPTIGNVISNSYTKAYQIDLKSMEDGAKAYILKQNIKFENGIPHQIQISDLVDEALIDPILDPKTKEECIGHVTVINNNDSYKFSPCLKCGTDYVSEDCNKTDFGIPTITLLGNNPVSIYVGKTYSDAGATAIDDVDGNITDKITVTGFINPDKPGLYTLTYNVKDNQGNEALSVTREINVIDNIDPIITFNPLGNEVYTKSRSTVVTVRDPNSGVKGSSLKYLWNTSTTGPSEASFSTTFANGGTIQTPSGVSGSYYLWIYAEDNSGNSAIARSNIFNLDNTKPIITINGNSTITMNVGTAYNDAGATALDNVDGNVTNKITTTNNVNAAKVGTYTVIYSVTDNAGNSATATRTVNVVDTTKPTITFGMNGNSTYAKSRSTTVTASDNVEINTSSLKYLWTTSASVPSEGSITTPFTNGGTINTPSNVTGDYYLWVIAKDTSGNSTISGSNLFKLDNTKPMITITGNATVTIDKGSLYSDAGATATDAHSGLNGSIVSSGTVNINVVGTYTITYNISDKAGNAATPVTRTVNVKDITAPVITILGSNPVSSDVGFAYSDAGATALDDVDGNVTSSITTTSTVNTTLGGIYTITYTVKDKAGNIATATRTVNMYATWYRTRTVSSATYYGNYSASSSTSYYCPSGYTSSGSGSSMTCSKTETTTRNSTTTYSCPSGYVSSGSGSSMTCSKTVSASSTAANVSCPSGWTMSSANNCYKNTVTPTTTYSCPSGATLVNTNQCRTSTLKTPTCSKGTFVSGSGCKVMIEYSSSSSCSTACGGTPCSSAAGDPPWICSSRYTYQSANCSSGYSMNSAKTYCYKYNYTTASSSKSCSDGATYVSSVNKCRIYTSSRVYSCSSGTLSGTTCYSCSSGTLSGTSCIQKTSPNSTTTYSCPSGYTSSGSGSSMTCYRTVPTSRLSSTTYSCPSGGSLSGTTCYRDYYSCSSGTLSGSSCYGSWSSWSTTKATASSTKEVQTEKRLTSY